MKTNTATEAQTIDTSRTLGFQFDSEQIKLINHVSDNFLDKKEICVYKSEHLHYNLSMKDIEFVLGRLLLLDCGDEKRYFLRDVGQYYYFRRVEDTINQLLTEKQLF